jgi:ABC-type hemin transport system ATPase subunit
VTADYAILLSNGRVAAAGAAAAVADSDAARAAYGGAPADDA